METIIPSHGNTLKILGKPKRSENGYRFMTYVLEQPVADGHLLFNVLTRELLLLTEDEYEDRKSLPELYEKWFLVPEGLDDMKYADQVRFIRKTVQKKPKDITHYTIYTTTDCNARCFYCFELGRARIPMNEETAHKVARYIGDHCGIEKKVHLEWFGGEPLFNKKVIDVISQDLQDLGIAYSSSMLSNGYLFDTETAHRGASCWNLKQVQISMDGVGEVYNRAKAYIYKSGPSPYEVVMGNIGNLIDENIRTIIRINVDKHNIGNASQLIKDLHERYGGRNGLSVYTHMLFEHAGPKEIVRAAEERRRLYEESKSLADMIDAFGFRPKTGLRRELPLNWCKADSGNSLTILPGGEIGLCDHYGEDNYIGTIESPELDQKVIQRFHEIWPQKEECRTCFHYPQCIRLKMCKEMEDCYDETRLEHREHMLKVMTNTYQAWKNKEEAEDMISIC